MRKQRKGCFRVLSVSRLTRLFTRGHKTAVTLAFAAVVALLLLTGPVNAYTIGATLTGDPRSENPDGIIVNVTITVDDATKNIAHWTVDINSPLHPNAKATEFYFNLVSDAKFSSLTFDNFSLSDWEEEIPASVAGGGSFTPNFQYEVHDDNGPPQQPLTNIVTLTFDTILTGGAVFNINDFLNAPASVSSDGVLGSGQLGMHVQSLNMSVGNATTDSGFVLGNYHVVPVPAAVWLLGSGLLGLVGFGRKWRSR